MLKYMKKAMFLVCVLVFPSMTFAVGPTPMHPPDDARYWTEDPVPYFLWSQQYGAEAYFLEFDDDNDWTENLGGLTVDTNYFDLADYITQEEWDPLVFNLYWRVRYFYFNDNLSEPGPVFHFSKTTADPPIPWTPQDEAILRPWSNPVIFTWSHYPNEDQYWMQFGSDYEFSESFGEFQWGLPNFDTAGFISPDEWHYAHFTLFWRISAADIYGNKSPWGPVAGFTKLGYRRVMCYGDSITGGYGSSSFDSGFGGYPPLLQDELSMYDDRSSVTAVWFSGGKAEDGAFNIEEDLWNSHGGIVIMMFGTVDIIDPGGCVDGDCRTIQRLEEIITVCDEYAVVPIICTVIPYNPAGGHPKFPDVEVIQAQLDELNQQIRELCQTEDIQMADLDQAMHDSAPQGDLTQLYFDWAHPNDDGYTVMSEALEPVVVEAW